MSGILEKVKRIHQRIYKIPLMKKLIIIIAVCILSGFVGELFFNLSVLRLPASERVEKSIDQSDLTLLGFNWGEGNISIEQDNAAIFLRFEEEIYIEKLKYAYTYSHRLPVIIEATILNEYGIESVKTYEDNNQAVINTSVVSIRDSVTSLEIKFPGNCNGLIFHGLFLDNTFNFSIQRFLFVVVCVFAVFFLVCFSQHKNKVATYFLIISLSLGSISILSMSVHRVGWDDEIHFGRSYSLFYSLSGKEEVNVSPTFWNLTLGSEINWPYDVPQSQEEFLEEIQFFNREALYRNVESHGEAVAYQVQDGGYASVGYLPQAIMIQIGKILRLPFSVIYIMGKFGNLACYCLIVYFAIRRLKIGQLSAAMISLFPTILFVASTYSVDAFSYAFILFGFSFILNEWVDKAQPVKSHNIILGTLLMAIGVLPKAIYCPIILSGIFIPKERFKPGKQKIILRTVFIGVLLLLASTFVLPNLLSPAIQGDTRGGDTSVANQLSLVLNNIFSYAKILSQSIYDTFGVHLFENATRNLAHYPLAPFKYLIIILIIFTVITDTQYEYTLSLKHKGILLLIIFSTICLIWTALYLGFTPVGNTEIAGVQGRYYLPIYFPLCLLFSSKKIKNTFNTHIYQNCILVVSTLILAHTVFQRFVVNMF